MRPAGLGPGVCALALLLAPAALAREEGPACVAVSIPPQAWLAERLAGPLDLEIEVVVPSGSSPETYAPGARALARLADCEVLITAGVPFEHALVPRLAESFPNLRLVDGQEGIALRAFGDAPGHDGEHGHAHGTDPHFWLDPKLALRHASLVARELTRLAPSKRAGIEARARALERELRALDAELEAQLAPLRGEEVAVYHPSFGYFLSRYGMRQRAIEEEGREPGPRRLAAIVAGLRDARVRVVVVQPEFSSASARRIADALGARTLTLDPLSRDYANNLRRMAQSLVEALGEDR